MVESGVCRVTGTGRFSGKIALQTLRAKIRTDEPEMGSPGQQPARDNGSETGPRVLAVILICINKKRFHPKKMLF